MKERKDSITFEDIKLCYEVYGEGNEVTLCFHGNGRTAEDFKFLAKENRKIISFHLFLHQCSSFDKRRITRDLIDAKTVEKMLLTILEKEKIEQFNFVAYSQGGRFVLSVLPLLIERVKNVYLIAPDGLNNYNFYSWSSRRLWARRLFKRWTEKPNELMKIAKTLNGMGIVDKKIIEFLYFYTSDKERLTRGYKSWSAFRLLQPDTEKIKQALNTSTVRFEVIIGKYDKIITAASARKFLNKIRRTEALTVLEFGHDIFKKELLDQLYEFIEI